MQPEMVSYLLQLHKATILANFNRLYGRHVVGTVLVGFSISKKNRQKDSS
jgi:hypothetical protein